MGLILSADLGDCDMLPSTCVSRLFSVWLLAATVLKVILQAIIGCGALPRLRNLLSSPRNDTRKFTCEAISLIISDSDESTQAVIKANILPPYIRAMPVVLRGDGEVWCTLRPRARFAFFMHCEFSYALIDPHRFSRLCFFHRLRESLCAILASNLVWYFSVYLLSFHEPPGCECKYVIVAWGRF